MNQELFEIKNSEVFISVVSAVDKNPEIEEAVMAFVELLGDLEKQDKEYEKLFIEVLNSKKRSTADKLITKYLKPVVSLGEEVSDYLVTSKKFTKKRTEREKIVKKLYGERPEFQDFEQCSKVEERLEDMGVDAQKVLRRWIRIQSILKRLEEIEEDLSRKFKYSEKLLKPYKEKHRIQK